MVSTKVACVMLFLFCSLYSISGNVLKAHFPLSNRAKFPRIQLERTLPTMSELTVCSWMRPRIVKGSFWPLFSYVVSDESSQLRLYVDNSKKDGIIVVLGGSEKSISCNRAAWKESFWNHLCLSWIGSSGIARLVVNGNRCNFDNNYSSIVAPGTNIKGGGVAFIGQARFFNGTFDSKFWIGDIADFHLWDEALEFEEINEIVRCGKGRREGNIFAWMKTLLIPIDGVALSSTKFCSG